MPKQNPVDAPGFARSVVATRVYKWGCLRLVTSADGSGFVISLNQWWFKTRAEAVEWGRYHNVRVPHYAIARAWKI